MAMTSIAKSLNIAIAILVKRSISIAIATTEFERAIMVSHKCSIVTLLLLCTVSEIMTFSCKPEMMSWCYIRQGTLHAVPNDGV